MSGLYSGITFSKSSSSTVPETAATAPASSSSGPSTATPEQKEVERQRQAALEDAARYAAQQAELQAKEAAESARKAALGFQPIVRKRPTAGGAAGSKGRPAIVIAAGPSATIAAPPSLIQSNASSSSGSAVISAPPSMDLHPAANSSKLGSSSISTTTSGRTLPPSMTLDETDDVNGFRSTQAGKKAANKSSKSKKKNNRSGLNKRDDDPSLAWTAEYDPSRPTDYNEYKAYSKRARSERRAALLRERQMEKRKAGMQSDGSEYTDEDDEDEEDSDTERRRRIANANNRFFAPPTSYDDASPAPQPSTSEEPPSRPAHTESASMQEDIPSSTSAPSAPPVEDSWASWSAQPAKTDDPFARRAALSQQRAAPAAAQPPARPEAVQRQPSPQVASYASPQAAPSFNAPSFVNAASSTMPPPPFVPPAPQGFPLPPHMMPPQPSSGSQSPQAFPPPAFTPPVTSSSESTAPAAKAIEEAQARARAIAARLASMGKFGGGGAAKASPGEDANRAASSMSPLSMPPIPSADEPIPGLGPAPTASTSQPPAVAQPKENVKPEDFAKNLMAKYGWSKGQGLGATSQGMVNPLSLAESEARSKKKEHNQSSSQHKGGPVGIATAKGRIVSDLKTEREQAEREKYGEPTRVVCLTNMVGRNEVDDELVSDVSEEARKLGVLEKCIVHVQPPYVPEDEAVRVFVVFSGLVGAWKAVKAFDGRYFGGRNVKAKFYNEQAFDLGVLHL
ncbi:hypothetical protein P389DRAFT_166780, partial [Cystobasidium minutum MCA 4210]|uniref:uncharacterized protein n=1 Tax=Cystobasidium minutum MCA 4210 TaxID=1397322 RepID=UPI0034CE2733|eukprot:jgi/Rhomi1/166780/fgenesh1_kg.2_\